MAWWTFLLRALWLRSRGITYSVNSSECSSSEDLVLPRVVLAFMAPDGIATSEIWTRWVNNARLELDELGLATLTSSEKEAAIGGKLCSLPSDLLVPVVSVRQGADLNDTSKFPCWLSQTIPQPKKAAWGNLHPIFHSIMKETQPTATPSTHYIFVSDTSIPVTSFTDILTELTADPRSHFDIWYEHFSACEAKTSGWFSLSQRHADMLLANEEMWVNEYGMMKSGRHTAQADEIVPFRTIVQLENNVQVTHSWLRNGMQQWMRKCLNTLPRTIAVRYGARAPFWGTHLAFWYSMPVKHRSFLGGGLTHPKHPLHFYRVNGHLLRFLKDKSWAWFARKFSSDSVVTACRNATENSFYEEWMGFNDAPRPRWPPPKPLTLWEQVFGPQRMNLNVSEDASLCLLKDYYL